MSDIDKRVVQMEFDNSKFDKNVKKSSATLSKFEKQLKFEDVEDSLNVVKKGFSALEIAGITAVSRITNAVINLGAKITKSLSIDRIADGWQKFGDKTIAVATLAAQKIVIAGKELDDYSSKMEGITEQLEKLEWFTNETSYTFNDMVAALGKFTAAGQDLDKSVNAMEGIATWAAMSGANAYKASSAMTQLAQTLGRGYVLKIDWQSIQTLNMDTAIFREQVLNTAVELGKLKKVGSDFITNTGKKITSVNFTDTLASKWFTSDILVKTLEKYSAAVDDIYKISEKEGISARQVIEKYGDSLDEFGVKAFKAAQETRTLGEAITYVMGTIGSTWSKTFELIIGGYDEAKEVWSDLSDALYDDIIAANDFRNEILNTWKELEGRSDLFKHGGKDQGAFWNIYDSIIAIKNMFSEAKEAIFPKSMFSDEADQAKELGQRFKEFTARLKETTSQILTTLKQSRTFTNILKGIYSIVKIIILVTQGIRASLDPIVQTLMSLVKNVFDRFGIFGDKLSRIEGIEEGIARVSNKIAGIVQKLMDLLNPTGVLDAIFEVIYDIKDALVDVKPLEQLESVFDSFVSALEESGGSEENFIRISEGVISIIKSLGTIIKSVISLVTKYVLPIINTVVKALASIAGVITGIVTNLTALIADFFTSLNELLDGSTDGLKDFGTNIQDFLNNIPSKIKMLEPILKSLTNIVLSLIDVLFIMPKLLNDISRSLTGKSIAENIAGLFERIAQALKTFRTVVESDSPDEENNLLSPIMSVIQGLVSMAQGILSLVRPLATLLGQVMNVVGNILKTIGNFLTDVVEGTWRDYKTITKVVLGIIAVAGIIALAVTAIRWLADSFHSLVNPLGYLSENVSDSIFYIGSAMHINSLSSLMFNFAAALLAFSVSIMMIGKMPTSQLKQGVTVIGIFAAILAGLIISLVAISKVTTKFSGDSKITKSLFGSETTGKNMTTTSYGSLGSISKIISGIALAMLTLSISIKMLGKLSPEQISKGGGILVTFARIISVLLISILLISKESKARGVGKKVDNKALINIAKIINSISLMMLSLAISLRIISSLALKSDSVDSLTRSVNIIYTIMGLITIMILIANTSAKKAKGAGPSIQALSALIKNISLLLLSITTSLLILSSIKDAKSLGIALGVVVGLLVMVSIIIAVFNKTSKDVTKNIKKDVTAKLGGTIFAMSMMLLSIAASIAIISSIAKDNFEEAKMAILGISLFIVLLIGVVYVLSKIGDIKGAASGILTALSIIVLLITFVSVAKQITSIGTDTIKNLAIMIGLIIGALLLLSIASIIVNPIALLAISVAMIALAASLILFSIGLQLFINALDSLTEIDQNMVNKLALALLELEAAGILAIAVGPGILALGVGLLSLAEAIKILSTCMDSIIPVMTKVFEGIALGFSTLIMTILTEFPKILVAGLEAIVDSMDNITRLLYELLVKVNEQLTKTLPIIVEIVTKIINAVLQVLINTTPKLMEFLKTLIKEICKLIVDTTPDLINVLLVLLQSLITFIIDSTIMIVGGIMDLISGILRELANRVPTIANDFIELAGSIIKEFCLAIPKLFMKILDGIISGLQYIVDHMEEYKAKFKKIGELLIEGLKEGLSGFRWTDLLALLPGLLGKLLAIFCRIFKINSPSKVTEGYGKNLMEGLANGIKNTWETVKNAITGACDKVKNWFCKLFNINSPSKVFAEYGDYMMQGLAKGISDNTDKANDELKDASKKLTNTISQVSNYIENTLDSDDLTIRPVLDLSDVNKGVNSIQSLMSGISGKDISVTGNMAMRTSRAIERQNSKSAAESGPKQTVTNEGDNYYSTFNITTNDPEEFAKEADKILQKLRLRANLAKGGAR